MKKLLLLLALFFFYTQGFTASYPPGAPFIVSDFLDTHDGKERKRDQIHQGIDIAGNNGQLILAAADGKVLEAIVEKCWGPTIAVDHGKGLDGNQIIALYGHLGEMLVTANEQVKRGQPIASLGNNQDIFEDNQKVISIYFSSCSLVL